MLDFNSLEKVDAHIHFNTDRSALLEQAKVDGFHLITINTEVPFFPDIEEQFRIAKRRSEGHLSFITTFSTRSWEGSGWQEEALHYIKKTVKAGALGVKVWKNIGMTLQNHEGDFIMIDDPLFDPVFDYMEKEKIPVLGHLGEPRNCWLPIEDMTVKGDRDYFSRHPEYHMYLHPEYPSYEEQIRSRDLRLAKHPNLRFIGAHLASLEWSIERQAEWLDRFPNAAMDLAERMCHLQHQAASAPDKVRAFLIRYQDRILYGTDVIDDHSLADEEIRSHIQQLWKEHWNFFQSSQTMTAPKVSKSFKGMTLPDDVISKIFRENALHWYSRLHKSGEK